MTPRKAALASGAKRYTAPQPCFSCGTFARYTANGSCCNCVAIGPSHVDPVRRAAKEAAQAARSEARTSGAKRYAGQPCSKCATTAKYTSKGSCVECTNLAVKNRKNPGRVYSARNDKNSRLKRMYGITHDTFDAMWAEQGGACGICAKTLHIKQGGHAVDHCHTTLKVRALLCHPCNAGIGLLMEDPAVLRAAAAYIETHRPE